MLTLAQAKISQVHGHLSTLEDRKQEYMKRKYRDVLLAWKVQNIIMFPGVHQFTKIADSKLISNFPIGHTMDTCDQSFFVLFIML